MVGAKEKEAYEAFEAGRLEYTEVMPVEQRCIASRENPNYNCTENLQTICVGVSAQSALFSAMTEAEVRRFCKALSLLIDREYMAYMSGRPEAGMAEEKLIARQVGGEATRGQEDVVERYHQALQLLLSLGWELDAEDVYKRQGYGYENRGDAPAKFDACRSGGHFRQPSNRLFTAGTQ